MEIKKSRKADLERRRGQWFALGLLLAVAAMYVALEYNILPVDPLDDADLMEQLTRDMELAPLLEPENQLAEKQEEEPKPQVKLVVVDNEEEASSEPEEEEEQLNDEDIEGDLTADDYETADPVVTDEDDNPLNFRVVEELPQFPGGPAELMKFLTKNLRYPESAKNQKIQGKVMTQFIVEKDGKLTDMKVVQSLHPVCDREAMRVLRMMPAWTAGVQDGKPCRTMVCIPIVFML